MQNRSRRISQLAVLALVAILAAHATRAQAGANPGFTFYGYSEIVPNPNPAIAGENTHFTITVHNPGVAAATNVEVQISYNDWGVTFMGWQPFGTQVIASIPAGGSATAEFDHVFQNRAHTCIEVLLIDWDQDDDLQNNRGQINMEVINAGETFGYNVPVVNNGDEDLNVHVWGNLHQGAGGGVPRDVVAKPIDEDLVVPAHGRVDVPVEIAFPPGTPDGTEVEYELNAFDLNAAPGDPAGLNHVVLRVVKSSARGLKQKCLLHLNGLPPGVPRAVQVKVEEIKKHILGSLDARLWQDDNRLKKGAAGRVFAAEKDAVKKLLDLLDNPGVPLSWKTALDKCARALTDAERILAQTAIKDAGGDAEAEADLAAADKLREAGKYTEAVKRYGHILIDLD